MDAAPAALAGSHRYQIEPRNPYRRNGYLSLSNGRSLRFDIGVCFRTLISKGARFVRRLVEFGMQDGGSVLVQVDEDRSGAPVTRGLGNRVVEQAQQSFEQAVGRVQPAVAALLAGLSQMADSPEQVQVQFGLQLSAETGAFVAAASTTGNFQVTMTWSPSGAPPPSAAGTAHDD